MVICFVYENFFFTELIADHNTDVSTSSAKYIVCCASYKSLIISYPFSIGYPTKKNLLYCRNSVYKYFDTTDQHLDLICTHDVRVDNYIHNCFNINNHCFLLY